MNWKIICCMAFLSFTLHPSKYNSFHPGAIWKDTDGVPIQAHGGGILFYKGTYYWYGENKSNPTHRQHVDVKGVSCYSSKDLYSWKNEGIVLPAVVNDSTHDLHFSKVLERPKVVYNQKTKKFVMWMHVDSRPGYKLSSAGVAISDQPTGPFAYLGSVRPNGAMSRDMTLFQDDGGRTFLFHSSEDNHTMYISELTNDYLKPNGNYKRIFINQLREAPAVFKHDGKYFVITSGCTGWSPNAANYAVADSIMGAWMIHDNPCSGPKSETSFDGQSSFVLPMQGKSNTHIFMADRWNPQDLGDSRYLWLPLQVKGDSVRIQWQDEWKIN